VGFFGIKTSDKRKDGQSYMSLCSERGLAELNDPEQPGRLLHFSSSPTGPGNRNDATQTVWRRMLMSAGRYLWWWEGGLPADLAHSRVHTADCHTMVLSNLCIISTFNYFKARNK